LLFQKKETIFGGGMKKKPEKSSSGLIIERLGEKYKKREQGSSLSNSELFSSLSSYIIYSFFF